MQRAPYSPERISVALGLCLVMLSALPRYLAAGHETRQTLIIIALILVASAAFVQWRMLSVAARQKLPNLLKRLVVMMLLGMAGMDQLAGVYFPWRNTRVAAARLEPLVAW